MHDRLSQWFSRTGVGMAIIGTVTQEQLLSVLSLLMTLLVHYWNGRQSKGELPKLRFELEYWKSRAYALDGRVDQLSSEVKELRHAQQVAVVPPFLPAEATTHCIEKEA